MALTERELDQAAAAYIELIAEHRKAGDTAAAGEMEEQLLELRGWMREPCGLYRDTTGDGGTSTRGRALRIVEREVCAARGPAQRARAQLGKISDGVARNRYN